MALDAQRKEKKKLKKRKILRLLVCMLALSCVLGLFDSFGEGSTAYARYYATPRLIVTGAEVEGGRAEAGKTFDLILHLENTSAVTDLVNISLKLSSAENRIVTASGSDAVYIDRLTKGEKRDVTVTMRAMPELEQKTYSVTCQFNYENAQKQTFTETASVSVPVYQQPRISVTEKKLSRSEIYEDGKTSLSMKVNNLGKGKVYNVSIDISGPTINSVSSFVGNLDMGTSKAVDISVSGAATGNDGITAIITYEDADGNAQQLREQFDLSVLAYEDELYEEGVDGLSPVVLGIVAGVVVVAILFIVVIARRKKERQYE